MMLHCLNTSGAVSNGADLTVLDWQQACMNWQQEQHSVSHDGVGNQFQTQLCGELLDLGQDGFPVVKRETRVDDVWEGFGNYGMPSAEDFVSSGYRHGDDSGTEYSYQNSDGMDTILTGRTSMRAENSTKKRKADIDTSLKVCFYTTL